MVFCCDTLLIHRNTLWKQWEQPHGNPHGNPSAKPWRFRRLDDLRKVKRPITHEQLQAVPDFSQISPFFLLNDMMNWKMCRKICRMICQLLSKPCHCFRKEALLTVNLGKKPVKIEGPKRNCTSKTNICHAPILSRWNQHCVLIVPAWKNCGCWFWHVLTSTPLPEHQSILLESQAPENRLLWNVLWLLGWQSGIKMDKAGMLSIAEHCWTTLGCDEIAPNNLLEIQAETT